MIGLSYHAKACRSSLLFDRRVVAPDATLSRHKPSRLLSGRAAFAREAPDIAIAAALRYLPAGARVGRLRRRLAGQAHLAPGRTDPLRQRQHLPARRGADGQILIDAGNPGQANKSSTASATWAARSCHTLTTTMANTAGAAYPSTGRSFSAQQFPRGRAFAEVALSLDARRTRHPARHHGRADRLA